MAYTISQLKVDLQGILHGTSLNKVTGPDELIARAGRQLLSDIDPQETKRVAAIDNALYDQVYDYVLAFDVKGDKISDIRPQTSRNLSDNLAQRYGKEFDLYKSNNTFAVEFNSGIKTLRISKQTTAGTLINGMDSLTANGTWAAAGGASNLAVDTIYKVTGSASLSFDVTGSTTSYIENSTMTQLDLSEDENKSAIFVFVYIPTPANLTSVTLSWGSSDADYYTRTVTSAHPSTAFQTGWNLLRFDWDGSTTVGTPVDTAIDYVRVSLAHTASDEGYRVDSIYSKLPSIYEVVYYSKFLFRTSAGVWQETITDDTNIVNLDTESYNLLLNQCAALAFQQMNDQGYTADIAEFKDKYIRGVMRYKGEYKSDRIPKQNYYYRMPKSPRG
jgi:hypothetical protein